MIDLPAGALAFNEEGLRKLKKGDDIKGAGAVTAAIVSSLIASAPQIIKAISDVRKANTEKASGKITIHTQFSDSVWRKQWHMDDISYSFVSSATSVLKFFMYS